MPDDHQTLLELVRVSGAADLTDFHLEDVQTVHDVSVQGRTPSDSRGTTDA